MSVECTQGQNPGSLSPSHYNKHDVGGGGGGSDDDGGDYVEVGDYVEQI